MTFTGTEVFFFFFFAVLGHFPRLFRFFFVFFLLFFFLSLYTTVGNLEGFRNYRAFTIAFFFPGVLGFYFFF